MSGVRINFAKPARLGQDGALALEDYARVASTFDAVVLLDAAHNVTGVHLAAKEATIPDAVSADIERFFETLVQDPADRLGWS